MTCCDKIKASRVNPMLHAMRTTLDIDDDVLAAAKEISRRQSVSAGKLLSQLARQALAGGTQARAVRVAAGVAGFRPIDSRGTPVTNEIIDSLLDAAHMHHRLATAWRRPLREF
jgi:hypothetical protein